MSLQRGRNKSNEKKLLIVGAIFTIIVVSVLASFAILNTTIYNRPVLDPIETQLTIYDNAGIDITDNFDTAIIADTVTFEVKFIVGHDRINGVTLVVEGTSEDASPGGYWTFENVIGDITVWRIAFDTTQLNNGEYSFDFYYTEEQPPTTYGGDPEIVDVLFSTFTFSWDGEFGTLSQFSFIPIIIVIGTVGLVICVGIMVMFKPKSKSHRKPRK